MTTQESADWEKLYRSDEEIQEWMERDPIKLFEAQLAKQNDKKKKLKKSMPVFKQK